MGFNLSHKMSEGDPHSGTFRGRTASRLNARSAGLGGRTLGWIGLTGVILLLSACSSTPEQKPVAPQPESPPAVETGPSESERRAARIEHWLSAADQALAQDRLLTPLGDNAHDRYRAVLLMEPDNARARSGLQAIVLRYLDLSRSAAARGALGQAETLLGRAREVDHDNPLIREMAEVIATEYERRASAAAVERDGNRYELNPHQLNARAPELVEQLQALAQEVQRRGDFVVIVSRTDVEGRWIYQQLREAVPGYRVRGNIHLGSSPYIELQSP